MYTSYVLLDDFDNYKHLCNPHFQNIEHFHNLRKFLCTLFQLVTMKWKC